MRIIRDWRWISNSRCDLLDFWCSFTIFISGIFLIFQDPERFSGYTYFDEPNTTRNIVASLFTIVGSMNLIKLFVPVKPPVMVNSAMKTLNFMLFVLLSLCEMVRLNSFPLALVFYSTFSIMALQNMLKTR